MTAGTVLHVIFDADMLQQNRYVVKSVFSFGYTRPPVK